MGKTLEGILRELSEAGTRYALFGIKYVHLELFQPGFRSSLHFKTFKLTSRSRCYFSRDGLISLYIERRSKGGTLISYHAEGVNGINRNGKKHYRLPTKREKNYRLPTGILLTDYRHWPTLSIFFSEKRVYCIFSTFQGSNQRYHVKYIQIYYKTRILKSV